MKKFVALLLMMFPLMLPARESIGKVVSRMPRPRQMYQAAVMGDFIYVMGGNYTKEDEYVVSVIFAPINPDGSLGEWKETSPLPENRCYARNSTIVAADYVYIAGGMKGDNEDKFNTVAWTKQKHDGTLEPWRISDPWPGKGLSASCASYSTGYIHIIGGTDIEGNPQKAVWNGRLAPDGSIVQWSEGFPLPENLWYHSGGICEDRFWIWGGLTTSSSKEPNPFVYSCPVNSDGLLGKWKTHSSQIPKTHFSGASAVINNYLFTFCPRYSSSEVSDDVWFTQISSGELVRWEQIKTGADARLYIDIAVDSERAGVFLPGGRMARSHYNMDDSVYFFPLRMGRSNNVPVAEPATKTPEAAIRQSRSVSSQTTSQEPRAFPEMTPAVIRTEKQTPVPTATTPLKTQAASFPPRGPTGQSRFPAFQTYGQAMSGQEAANLPVVMYFHNPNDPEFQSQSQILSSMSPTLFQGRAVLVEIDVTRQPGIARNHYVTETPHWIFFDAVGNAKIEKSGVLTPEMISSHLHQN